MKPTRCNAWWTRPVAAARLLALTASCTTWRASGMSPRRALERPPDQVRLTLSNGSKATLFYPQLKGDSIIGSEAMSGNRRRYRSVAAADVASVELLATNTALTLAAAAGMTLLIVAVASAVSANNRKSRPARYQPPRREPALISCPLVYSWDGTAWHLESGTFGGAIAPALARTEIDVLSRAATDGDLLRLKVTNEQPETDHVDAIAVLAVDHEPGVTPAVGQGRIHTIGEVQRPVAATDADGRDVLARVAELDGWAWESAPRLRDPGDASALRDGIEVSFIRPAGATDARLVLDARTTVWASHLMREYLESHGNGLDQWFAELAADPERTARFRERLARDAFLRVSVLTDGDWHYQGLAWDSPPELVRRQVVPLDLAGIEGDTVRVLLDAPPAFWLIDQVGIAFNDESEITVRRLSPETATDLGGRSVLHLLAAVDGRHYVMERGDEAELVFRVPEPPAGAARTYLVEAAALFMAAAAEAWDDAGLGAPPVDSDRFGLVEGSSIGTLPTVLAQYRRRAVGRQTRMHRPSDMIRFMAGAGGSAFAQRVGIQGPVMQLAAGSVSGAYAIGEAFQKVAAGWLDVVVCGGADAPLQPEIVDGFTAAGVLARRTDVRDLAGPFDRRRAGTALGDAAGALVLESARHAAARGARPRAVVVGYGTATETHSAAAPDPDGTAVRLAVERALPGGRTSVSWIKAHATGTLLGDAAECRGLAAYFGDRLPEIPLTGMKFMLGHSLGASGAVEAVAATLALQHEFLPACIGTREPDPTLPPCRIALENQPCAGGSALLLSESFGGRCAALVLAA